MKTLNPPKEIEIMYQDIAPATELLLRAPTLDDIPATVTLLNLCTRAQTGLDEFTEDSLLQEWRTPGFDPQRQIRLAEVDGQLVGFIEHYIPAEHLPALHWGWGRTHPAWEGQGIGTRMLEWVEAEARRCIPRVPDDIRVSLRSDTLSTHAPPAALLQGYGMTLIRHFWRMEIEMDVPPPAPQWPEGITLRPFDRERDGLAVYRALDEAFEDHWGHIAEPEEEGFARWAHFAFDPDRFVPELWFVAVAGDEIAGIARNAPKSWDDASLAWLHQLGVRRPWRRSGLGLALLLHSFGAFYARGQRRVGLGVDAANPTGATRLYERAGMKAVRQYDTYEKELRPGRDPE